MKNVIGMLMDALLRAVVKLVAPFATLRVGGMGEDRVGSWLPAVEFHLRQRVYNPSAVVRQRCVFFIGAPCNEQVLTMMRRVLFIVRSDILTKLLQFTRRQYPNRPHWIYLRPVPPFADGDVWNNVGPQLGLSPDEIHRGREFEQSLGVRDVPYVCFAARDRSYLKAHLPRLDASYHNYRDWDIRDIDRSLEYLSLQGIWSLRVGAIVEKEFESDNPMIVDYSWHHRTDFLDIYLLANCKFFVGDSAGIYFIPQCLGRPFLQVNHVPMNNPSLISTDLFIPKKLKSRKEQRFLTFREMYEMGAHTWGRSSDFEAAGIQTVCNSREELLAATQEMNMKLDGDWIETEEDEEMQILYREISAPFCSTAKCHSRMASSFLRANKALLG